MPEKTTETVYLDSSVWVALLLENDQHHKLVRNEFQEMGAVAYCTSDLAILEVVHVIRKTLTKKFRDTSISKLDQTINDKIILFYRTISDMQKENTLKYIKPDYKLGNFLKTCRGVMTSIRVYDAVIKKHHVGKRGGAFEYVGPGHWDIQHALIARLYGCTKLCTLDAGYELLKPALDFDKLQFVIWKNAR